MMRRMEQMMLFELFLFRWDRLLCYLPNCKTIPAKNTTQKPHRIFQPDLPALLDIDYGQQIKKAVLADSLYLNTSMVKPIMVLILYRSKLLFHKFPVESLVSHADFDQIQTCWQIVNIQLVVLACKVGVPNHDACRVVDFCLGIVFRFAWQCNGQAFECRVWINLYI